MVNARETRLIQQAYRFELDPNREQRVLLAKSVGASRFVYNWGLAESRREYELTGRRPRLGELRSRLVQLKKGECPWLYEVSAHIGQQALVDLDKAFDRFFKGLKSEGPRSGYPRFKRKGERDSARLYEFTVAERYVSLPLIGRVRLKERSHKLKGRPIAATITRRADRWFVSFTVEREREIDLPRGVERASDVVGVDLGLANAAVIHDGNSTRVVEPQQALRKNLRKLRRLDRLLSRKQRGSRNREKAKLSRGRLHYKISCQRSDFLHKLSSDLTRTKSVIVLEDLHVRGMQRNKHLALSIGDAGLGELRRQLAYKSEWHGARLVLADRFFPSTQLCSGCGCLNEKMRGLEMLQARRFDCSACGISLDRDENAALNLRRCGLNTLVGELPMDHREVTPDGEDGSGASLNGAKPASLKQEAKARRRPSRQDPRTHIERRASTVSTSG